MFLQKSFTTSRCERMVYIYLERIFVLISERYAEPRNGITPAKLGLMSKGVSTISKSLLMCD